MTQQFQIKLMNLIEEHKYDPDFDIDEALESSKLLLEVAKGKNDYERKDWKERNKTSLFKKRLLQTDYLILKTKGLLIRDAMNALDKAIDFGNVSDDEEDDC